MTAVENKYQSLILQPISPSIHAKTAVSTQRERTVKVARSSSTSTVSSTSSLRSRQFVISQDPIQEHNVSLSSRPLYVSNSSIQPTSRSRHYVNVCQYPLPPPSLRTQCSPCENCVSDSEISTSSAASVSTLSESSEIRALFSSVHRKEQPPSTTSDLYYNQLKVKPGSKVSERTRRILYRPHHFESDSSSSLAESGDSLNMPEKKQSERDHYNKLKLNLDNISGNKRAMMGLKVLYRDPPRGYRPMSRSSPPTRSLLQQRRPRGIFHQKSIDHAKPRTRYWSEGHSNKIHSVAPDPVRSRSLTWRKDESHHHLLDAVTKTPPHSMPVYRTRSLNDTQSFEIMTNDMTLRKVKQKSSRSTDNLSHMSTTAGHAVAQRSVSLGERSPHNDATFFQRKKRVLADPGGVGRQHSSNRGSTSLEHGNNISDFDQDRSSGSINFIMSPIILKYEGEELDYHSTEHQFTISIPKGALKKKGTVEVQVGLALHGPFIFPERSRNVSPILWLCSIPDTKFRKPIMVTLPHCITGARPGPLKRMKPSDCLTLHFTSASLKSATSGRSRKRHFEFNATEGEEAFSSKDGSFLTKHLSPLCIVATCGKTIELPRQIALDASYCIVPVLPVTISGREWNIHFCVTFNLQSCIQSLKKYFSESEFQLMPPYPFKFSPPVICDDKWGVRASQDGLEPELEIRFPRELPESGWRLILQSERKLSSSAISFSPCRRLESLTSSFTSSFSSSTIHCSPPPMFTISVDGAKTERAAVTCVSFVGSIDPVTVKVTLPLNDTDGHKTSSPPPCASEYDHLRFDSASTGPSVLPT